MTVTKHTPENAGLGMLRIDLRESLCQSTVDPQLLSSFQRILLTTDGRNPEVLKAVHNENLGDRMVMEVKGPADLYEALAGEHPAPRRRPRRSHRTAVLVQGRHVRELQGEGDGERAVELGWREVYLSESDPRWTALKDNERYQAVMAAARAEDIQLARWAIERGADLRGGALEAQRRRAVAGHRGQARRAGQRQRRAGAAGQRADRPHAAAGVVAGPRARRRRAQRQLTGVGIGRRHVGGV